MKRLVGIPITLLTVLFLVGCGSPPAPALPPAAGPTASPADIPFMGVQMGGGSNPTAAPEPSGQQIAFSVKGGAFTYLKIDGTDPYGQWKTWQTSSETGLAIAGTDGYWWKGTVVLVFDIVDVGRRSCVIDYLLEAPGSTMAAIVYSERDGCSGEGGSAERAGSTEVLIEYMYPSDARQVVEAADLAYSAAGCLQGIAGGFAGGMWGKVMVIKDCAGASLSVINETLLKYDLQVTDR